MIPLTILSDIDIIECLHNGDLKIAPFCESSLTAAGYDLSSSSTLLIHPLEQGLIHTIEHLELGPSLCGQIYIRSSFAREGLLGSFAFIDPGFKGQLTLSLVNLGASTVQIGERERIAQVVFSRTGSPSSRPYSGRYQNSKGTVPSHRIFNQTYKN